MKEIIEEVEEWDNNPREMWVWDNSILEREKRKVIYMFPQNVVYRVVSVDTSFSIARWRHCSELDKQLMTKRELSRWLREKSDREYKIVGGGNAVLSDYTYYEDKKDELVSGILVREGDGEWHEPLKEVDE